tara:strand:- start:690 stop:1331 length:642 start_codon:yes stop_codon:yes gene_type:complete
MSFTYTTLKQAIQDYTNNTETLFVNNLDRFIQQSEERIFKNVNLPAFKKNVTGTSTAGNEFLSTPSDFIAPFSLAVDNSGLEHLMFRDLPFIRESYPDANVVGVPKYYSLFDEDSMIMAPTPNADFRFEFSYFYRPDSITISSDGTSWLGTNAPNALLYGALVEAYTFMKGSPDIMQNYQQRFEAAIDRLKNIGEGKDTKDNFRSGPVRRRPN